MMKGNFRLDALCSFKEVLCLRYNSLLDEFKGKDYGCQKDRHKIGGFMTTIHPYHR
jgi:hypothetical protein